MIDKKEKVRVETLLETCRELLRKEKIPASEQISGIEINSRVRRRFGRCTKEKNTYKIEVSAQLLSCRDDAIENVILHELLHTCPGCMNHGKRWQNYAGKLNEKYGYRITTRTSYEALGMEDPGSREDIKYMIVCRQCGARYPRRRKCRLVENVDRYACGKCGGKLEIQ